MVKLIKNPRMDEWKVPGGVEDALISGGIKLAGKGIKYLWKKAKGHDLPRVKVSPEMTAAQTERAYKRFKRTASGKSLKEARGDQLTRHIVIPGRVSMGAKPWQHSPPSWPKSKIKTGPKVTVAHRKRSRTLSRYSGPMTSATKAAAFGVPGPPRGSKIAKQAADELRSKRKLKKTLASIPTASDIDQTTRNRITNEARGDQLRKKLVRPSMATTNAILLGRHGPHTSRAMRKRRDVLQSYGIHAPPVRGSQEAKQAATELKGRRKFKMTLASMPVGQSQGGSSGLY